MAKYLVNAVSLGMFDLSDKLEGIGLFTKKLQLEEFCGEAKNAVSAIGHQATADMISQLCNTTIATNRVAIKVGDNDELVVFQLKERLPEGKVLTKEELQKLLEENKIELIKLRVRYAARGRVSSGGNNIDISYIIDSNRIEICQWNCVEFEGLIFGARPEEQRPMDLYVYVFDEFKKVNIDAALAKSLASRPLELFKAAEDKVKEATGEIESIRPGKVYTDEKTGEFVVEYLAKVKHGRVSVKLIYSKDPAETLRKFYEQEEQEYKRRVASSHRGLAHGAHTG